MGGDIEVILFDLGGVLVELGPTPVPARALAKRRQYSLSAWLREPTAIAFETGAIGADEFAAALIAELDLDCSDAELIEHFRAWPRRLYPGVAELLEKLRPGYRLAVLSNTNDLHLPRFTTEFGLSQLVDEIFASHLLGLAKPDPRIFIHVSEALAVAPGAILFVDDNERNVDSAAELGFHARKVQGLCELEQALEAYGISTV